jgi:hypothetical protein
VLGAFGYKLSSVATSEPFHLPCHKNKGQDNQLTHYLCLQLRLEMGSAYVSYLQLGFTKVPFDNGFLLLFGLLQRVSC